MKTYLIIIKGNDTFVRECKRDCADFKAAIIKAYDILVASLPLTIEQLRITCIEEIS